MQPTDIECFHLGDQDGVFGTLHPAEDGSSRSGIVIAPPLFHEAYKSHFVIRRSASALAASGHSVLRIDYSGTGDSHLDLVDLPKDQLGERWSSDISNAIETMRAELGARSVSLVAFRFAAALSAGLDQHTNRQVWIDPVMSGRRYLDQLYDAGVSNLQKHPTLTETNRQSLLASDPVGLDLSMACLERAFGSYEVTEAMPNTKVIMTHNPTPEAACLGDAEQVDADMEWVTMALKLSYAHGLVAAIQNAF